LSLSFSCPPVCVKIHLIFLPSALLGSPFVTLAET
jgi:hypothetical protein